MVIRESFKPGDVVLCLLTVSGQFTRGKAYEVSHRQSKSDSEWVILTKDDNGSTTNGLRYNHFVQYSELAKAIFCD